MGDCPLSRFGRDHAVEALVLVPSKIHIVRHDVEHADRLAENEDLVTVLTKTNEEFVEKHHLAAVHDEAFERFILVTTDFYAIE